MSPPSSQRHRRPCRAAFTLVEILLAAAITVLLLGSLLTVAASVTGTWSRANVRVETGTESRIAFEVLARDLESAVFDLGAGGGELFQLSYDGAQGTATASGETAWLTFFAPAPDRDLTESGDICAVSYRLHFQDPIASAGATRYPVFGLYRALVPPRETFDEVRLGADDLMGEYWDAGTAETGAPEHFLCNHVVGFDLAITYRDPATGELATLPAGEPARIAEAMTSPALAEPVPRGAIDSIELTLSVLSEQGARLAEVGALPMDELLRRHGMTFTRRIALRTGN